MARHQPLTEAAPARHWCTRDFGGQETRASLRPGCQRWDGLGPNRLQERFQQGFQGLARVGGTAPPTTPTPGQLALRPAFQPLGGGRPP
jgi:hypothetical protein